MQKKLEVIDMIKVIMMLTVVFYHCCMFFTGSWFDIISPVYEARYISALARYLNTFHVATFTMASGYLFCCLRTERGKYQDNLISDIKKRARRLLLPYFATLLFWVIPYDLFFNGFDMGRFIHNFVLGYSPAQLWFLPMLFWIFILFYFLIERAHVTTKGLICVSLISIGGGYCLNKIGLNIFQFAMAVKFFAYYYLGAYFYQKNYNPRNSTLIISALISIVSFVNINVIYSLQNANHFDLLIETLNFVCSIAGIVMVYSCVSLIQGKISFLLKTWVWRILKKHSFGVYLFHQQIVYLTIICLNGKVHPIVQVIVGFVFSVFVSSVMDILLQKLKYLKCSWDKNL